MFEMVERSPSAEEFNDLRNSVGWGIFDKNSIEQGLKNSLFIVCVISDEELIGTARIVGDGFTVFYIQDVIVKPAFQRMGIGIMLMNKIMDYVGKKACSGAMVGLMSAQGKEAFYEKFGFWKRPNEKYGCGMMQHWENNFLGS